ncbi:hypothetical protein [Kribbella deserti]|uniref:Uncharacterized protein n=1 Tax=Kribbella deserti TaxID=1926257 RepID=A0ABV6QLW7_9ACTN
MTRLPVRTGRPNRDGRQISRFAHRLTVLTGVPVSLRWRPTTSPYWFGKDWQLVWSNGPTIARMRALAGKLAGHTGSVTVEHLQWSRCVLPSAFGLALIHNVRAGLPPLGDATSCNELLAQLDEIDYPEHGSPRDVLLAERLTRLGNHHEQDMLDFLTRYGLPGLGEGPLAPTSNLALLPQLQNDAHPG